jgi:hypothetical protein
MVRKFLLIAPAILIPIAALAFLLQGSTAAGPTFGCKPYNLTVKTGQMFYFTVAVTDTIDLYAWQMDATYYPEYLEFLNLVPANHLISDGAHHYMIDPTLMPGPSTNEIRLAAYTRLGTNVGIDGSGAIAYIFFKAVTKKTDGTNVTLNDRMLVDSNALDVPSSFVNSGRCKVIISDTAPPLIQPAINPLYLPTILR